MWGGGTREQRGKQTTDESLSVWSGKVPLKSLPRLPPPLFLPPQWFQSSGGKVWMEALGWITYWGTTCSSVLQQCSNMFQLCPYTLLCMQIPDHFSNCVINLIKDHANWNIWGPYHPGTSLLPPSWPVADIIKWWTHTLQTPTSCLSMYLFPFFFFSFISKCSSTRNIWITTR